MHIKSFIIYNLLILFYLSPGVSQTTKNIDILALNTSIASSIVKHISYYEDPSGRLSFSEIQKKKFIQNTKQDLNFGQTTSFYWVKIQLNNSASTQHEWLLEIRNPLLRQIDFYQQDSDSSWQHTRTGHIYAFETRSFAHRNFVFPLSIQDNSINTYYIKIQTYNSLYLPLYLSTSHAFYHQDTHSQIFYGIFIGIILMVMLNSLIIYFSIKQKAYFYYVLYILNALIFSLFISGYLYPYFWTTQDGWQEQGLSCIFASMLITGTIYAIYFLNIKKYNLRLFQLFKLEIYINLCVFLFSPFLPYYLINTVLSINALVLLILVFTGAIIIQKRGYSFARYYIFAYLIYFIGALFVVMRDFGLTGSNFLSLYGIEIGILGEAIFLLIALKQKYETEKKMHLNAHKNIYQEKIRVQKEAKNNMESEILQRTGELKQKNKVLAERQEEIINQRDSLEQQREILEELNATKDKFFYILAHDLKGPLNALTGFSELLVNNLDVFSKDEIRNLGRELGNSTKNIHQLLENLLNWSRSQTGKVNYNFEVLPLNTLILNNIELLKPLALQKQIHISFSDNQIYDVKADRNAVNTIIRNLLSNGIKFTPSSGNIDITLEEKQSYIQIEIHDNGVGIPEEIQKKIFRIDSKHTTRGTANEKGTGLGLTLCKEFVEKNGGEIWVESKLHQGSSFFFTLPKSQLQEKALSSPLRNI